MNKKLTIASDFTGTVAGHIGLCTALATLSAKGHAVEFHSKAPPEGFTLKMFKLHMQHAIADNGLGIDVDNLVQFQKKDATSPSKPHFNIVFDDEDVDWCTFDYHVGAQTPAFEAIVDAYIQNQNLDLVTIIECYKSESGVTTVNSLAGNNKASFNYK